MFEIPKWVYVFHGHECPFMPIGYRMGALALEKLNIERSKNHEMHVFSEMGTAHPQGCMEDGIMAATGATFGKGLIEKLYYGKVAAIFWYPGKEAVRIALKNEFLDMLAPHEFFQYRKKGIEPSEIPENIRRDIINKVLQASNDDLFNVKKLPGFKYEAPKSSFNKGKCEICGEYVFERYLRVKDGQKVCIACSGHEEAEFTRPRIKKYS
jgi:formylmethanofuran dehydrogenase subunit E